MNIENSLNQSKLFKSLYLLYMILLHLFQDENFQLSNWIKKGEYLKITSKLHINRP